MKNYFELVNLEVPCVFILQDGSRYDLRTGFPKNSLEVYKSGFKSIGLLPGAEELFKKEKVGDLVKLIAKARRIQDVEVLLQARPESKTIQEAAEKRKNELSTK